MTANLSELRLIPSLTPHGHLILVSSDDAPALEHALGERIQKAFGCGAGHGLLWLGAAEVGQVLPPALAYWRELAGHFVTALCTRPDIEEGRAEVPGRRRVRGRRRRGNREEECSQQTADSGQ